MKRSEDLFLLVDSSDRIGLIGLYRAGQTLWESRTQTGRPSLKWIGDSIMEAQGVSGVNLNQLAFLACGVGPGGFTSARLGLSVIKAMSQAQGLPLVSLNRLESAAFGESILYPRSGETIYSVRMPAARDLDYFAVYRIREGHLPECVREPAALPPAKIARLRIPKSAVPLTLSPESYYAGQPRLAWTKWKSGATVPFIELSPLYLRGATLGPVTSKVKIVRKKIMR